MFKRDSNTVYKEITQEYIEGDLAKRVVLIDMSNLLCILKSRLGTIPLSPSDIKAIFMFTVEYSIICFSNHEYTNEDMADELFVMVSRRQISLDIKSHNMHSFVCKVLKPFCNTVLDYVHDAIRENVCSDSYDISAFLPYKWNFIKDDSVELSLLH